MQIKMLARSSNIQSEYQSMVGEGRISSKASRLSS